MKKIVKFLILVIFAILILIPLVYPPNYGRGTVFVVREFDFPIEWKHGDVKVAEILPEELNQYPILKNLINDNCTKFDGNWWCEVTHEEWSKTKDFIDKKENAETCIKISEKCYIIDFVTCCTKEVEIAGIVLGRCACPPDMEIQEGQNNEIGLNLEITILNNQSIGTDLLTYKINIINSSNVIVGNYTSDIPVYIKSNSSIGIMTTVPFPSPGEYTVEVQILEKGKILTKKSTNIYVEPFYKSPISNEDYEIYSVVLRGHGSKSIFNNLIDKFVIRGLTYNGTYDLWDSYINNLEGYTQKNLDIGLVNDFKIKNLNKSRLENKFSIPQKVILISENELDDIFRDEKGWDRFYERYPNSSGIIELSRVGFNNNHTQALLYYGEQSHFVAGSGYLIFLIKEEGKWIAKDKSMLWIS